MKFVNTQLALWGTKGVYGHFKDLDDSIIPPWLQHDEKVAVQSAKIVGALTSEVAVMQTLSANLHLLMASFYRPTKDRYKIILEGKAFPSDHYIVESQLRHHGLELSDSMVLIEPPSKESPLLPLDHILKTIDEHADSTALLLLPSIQFYTGQYFDIKTITAHAQTKGIIVGWDCAHAAGNVDLKLHDWNVDFAAWCTYKYLNCGPGAIGGLFVHDRHTQTPASNANDVGDSATSIAATGNGEALVYRHRLAGWWGSTKSSRFAMTNEFVPIPGAGGFQLSNPSALDMSAVMASLSVFEMTDMATLRNKSLQLTAYLEELLDTAVDTFGPEKPWEIITPRDPQQRGAQLSVLLKPGLLDGVMRHLEEAGIVLDERKPDVIRIAPAPLYNTWEDVWTVVEVLKDACVKISETGSNGQQSGASSVMVDGGQHAKGWGEIK